MHDFNPGDIARPSVIRHAVAPGEDEQVLRIFQRNASLAQLHPEDRRAFYAAMASQAPMADGVGVEPVRDGAVRGYWLRPAVSDPSSARHGAKVRLDVFEDMYHVFQRDVGALKTAEAALAIAARFIDDRCASLGRP
jgi:hypothetical protein